MVKSLTEEPAEHLEAIPAAQSEIRDILSEYGAPANLISGIDILNNKIRTQTKINYSLESQKALDTLLGNQRTLITTLDKIKQTMTPESVKRLDFLIKQLMEAGQSSLDDMPANETLKEASSKTNFSTADYHRVTKIRKAPGTLLHNLNPEEVAEENIEEVKVPLVSFAANLEDAAELLKEGPAITLDVLPLDDMPESLPEKPIEEKYYYKMQPGQSLADIAKAICGDVNGWLDLYYANQALIDGILSETQYYEFNDFETDAEIFAGLDLEIPMVFTKVPR